ncbi:MAG: metallophosphoesterase [Deinococcaceae bacterium]
MIKVIAIGDVHADFGKLWAALRTGYATDEGGQPTPPLLDGRYQVILMGDLVHPKTKEQYELLTGREPFEFDNPKHLVSAARAQIRELYRIKRFQESAPQSVHIILGNHDDAALNHNHRLGNAHGISHIEFEASQGGLELPEDLQTWIKGFSRDIHLGSSHFAHAGPLPSMGYFDDMFYSDKESKRWWQSKGRFVTDAGYSFGVYGHTLMHNGIHIDELGRFAMIDALDHRQFLELFYEDDLTQKPTYRSVVF